MNINTIDLNIKSIDIKAGVKKIRNKWTTEMVNDLSFHSGFGSDIERQLIVAIRKEKRIKTNNNLLNNI